MLGHCADSHTVCSPRPRASFLRLWKFSPEGALALSHSGLGCRTGGPIAIWTSCDPAAMYNFDFTWSAPDQQRSVFRQGTTSVGAAKAFSLMILIIPLLSRREESAFAT